MRLWVGRFLNFNDLRKNTRCLDTIEYAFISLENISKIVPIRS